MSNELDDALRLLHAAARRVRKADKADRLRRAWSEFDALARQLLSSPRPTDTEGQ